MKNININSALFRWTVFVFVLVIPICISHLWPSEAMPRLVAIIWFHVFAPIFTLILTISPASQLWIGDGGRDAHEGIGDKEKRKMTIVRTALALMTILGFGYAILPIQIATHFFLNGAKTQTVEGKVIEQRSSVLGTFFLHRYVDLDSYEPTLSFYFPNQLRSDGQRYRFEIIPNTDLVLDSEPID